MNSTILKDKLHKVIEHSGMSRNRFAEVMGIQPSGLSHILSGRNNPGYDFIVKLIARFPEINPYWLLGDSDKMLNDLQPGAEENAPFRLSVADDAVKSGSAPTSNEIPVRTSASADLKEAKSKSQKTANVDAIVETMADLSSVEKVVIFFADRTFEVFTPRRKDF